jgi:hypothetical protein
MTVYFPAAQFFYFSPIAGRRAASVEPAHSGVRETIRARAAAAVRSIVDGRAAERAGASAHG